MYPKQEEMGTRIRAWRSKAGPRGKKLILKKLSKMLGVSQGSLSDIENNKSFPSAPTLAQFCQHTNIDIIWVLTGVNGHGVLTNYI